MGKEFASHTIYKGSLDVKSQTIIFFKDDTGEYIYDRKARKLSSERKLQMIKKIDSKVDYTKTHYFIKMKA